MSSNVSKKRKRDSDRAEEVTLQLSVGGDLNVRPVVASFPSIQPPESTPFVVYQKRGDNSSDNTIIVGETDTVEFISTDEGRSATAGCSYLVGIYNKRTKTVSLQPAPLYILSRTVKAMKNLKPIEMSAEERVKQRNILGETFGTKKAKARIRAEERNRVDIDAMKGVAGHLQDRIQDNTSSLPTQEEAKAAADNSRLIPPYNEHASRPDDIYKVHDIIPEAEFNALSIHKLRSAADRRSLLPHSRSNWINQHLNLQFSAPKPNKTILKILLYISTMFAFRASSRLVNDKQALQERLKDVPTIVVDGLLSRFTETSRDKNEAKITPQTETMLLTYMFALCLRVDDFATDTALLASDLGMAAPKVNTLFKALGCKIETLNATELKRLGLPDSAGGTKRAVLKVPLEFPKARVRRTVR